MYAIPMFMNIFALEGGTVSVANLIAVITELFTAAIGWVGQVATTVTSTPILLLGATLGLVGLGVGLFNRLMRV